ncbi:hypothetical protein [Nocardioides kribbensis]|uniref:hypothetical protein n=1 Tax=Nocardioides kribbensis TaxID=305517 RepID=UPI0032DA02C1
MPTSPRARRVRRVGLLAAGGLVAGLLPLVGPAGVAQAAEACTTEVAPRSVLGLPTGPPCDDIAPPETTITALTPPPNAAGYLRTDDLTFTFSGRHTDGDTDPISFECQLDDDGASTNDRWEACQSPRTYQDLEDSSVAPYTFRVRAVDTADDAIDATAPPGLLVAGAETDLPDLDESAAVSVVRVDTVAPNTFVLSSPPQLEGYRLPIADSLSPQVRLAADEGGSTFACDVDGAAVPCAEGVTTLRGLGPGDKTLTVRATDRAGNTDPTLKDSTAVFAVPADLTAADGGPWRSLRSADALGGSFLETRERGAMLRYYGRNVRELLLIGPSGPGAGSVEVKIGRARTWQPVDLATPTVDRQHLYTVRDQNSPLRTGTIRIRVTSDGRPVRLDGILAH